MDRSEDNISFDNQKWYKAVKSGVETWGKQEGKGKASQFAWKVKFQENDMCQTNSHVLGFFLRIWEHLPCVMLKIIQTYLYAFKEDVADDNNKTQIDNVNIETDFDKFLVMEYTRTPYSSAIFNYVRKDAKAKL